MGYGRGLSSLVWTRSSKLLDPEIVIFVHIFECDWWPPYQIPAMWALTPSRTHRMTDHERLGKSSISLVDIHPNAKLDDAIISETRLLSFPKWNYWGSQLFGASPFCASKSASCPLRKTVACGSDQYILSLLRFLSSSLSLAHFLTLDVFRFFLCLLSSTCQSRVTRDIIHVLKTATLGGSGSRLTRIFSSKLVHDALLEVLEDIKIQTDSRKLKMDLKSRTHFNKEADRKTHNASPYYCVARGAFCLFDELCSGLGQTYLSKISCRTESHDLIHGTNIDTLTLCHSQLC